MTTSALPPEVIRDSWNPNFMPVENWLRCDSPQHPDSLKVTSDLKLTRQAPGIIDIDATPDSEELSERRPGVAVLHAYVLKCGVRLLSSGKIKRSLCCSVVSADYRRTAGYQLQCCGGGFLERRSGSGYWEF
jgi:hypothetical protein